MKPFQTSLALLPRVPLRQVKIDPAVAAGIATQPGHAVIAKTTIAMAHDLGLEAVAVGVDTEAQRNLLRACGCPLFQGHLFGRPLPQHRHLNRA